MQLIAEVEGERRGLYGGAVGYLGYDGNLDTAITIRSAVLCEDRIHLTVGAGIVAGSVPEREFEETEHKAGAVRRAIELAIAEAAPDAAAGAASGTTTPRGASAAGAAAGAAAGSGATTSRGAAASTQSASPGAPAGAAR
jgi:anthranilate synthase component 1